MCKEHSADCTYQDLGQYTATTYRYHLSASDSLTPPFANTLLLHCSYSVLHSHLCCVTVSRTSLAPFGAFVRFRCNWVPLLCDRHEAKVPQKGAGRPPWRCGDRYRDSTQSRPQWTNSGRLFDQTVWVWQIHLISYLISYPISYLISYVSILFHILFILISYLISSRSRFWFGALDWTSQTGKTSPVSSIPFHYISTICEYLLLPKL